MLNEDRGAFCNLPQAVVFKEWPNNRSGKTMGRMDDLYTQASKQMSQDVAYLGRDYKPTKF
jgi:hypothetical protein